MGSSESEDEVVQPKSKTTTTNFSEMLKNKMQQTHFSPANKIKREYEFNPPASSTQIGTPDEFKKHSRKLVNKNSKKVRDVPKMQSKQSISSSGTSDSESDSEDSDNSGNKSSQRNRTISSDGDTQNVQIKQESALTSESEDDENTSKKLLNSSKSSSKFNNKNNDVINKEESSSDSSGSSNSETEKIQSKAKIVKRKTEVLSDESSSDEFVSSKSVKNTVDTPLSKSPASRLKILEEQESLRRLHVSDDPFGNKKSKEEIFLIQIPIKLDPNLLIGSEISLSESMRVRQNKKYDSVPTFETQETLSLLTANGDDKICLVKPVGYIKIQRRLKGKHISRGEEISSASVPQFPENLKQRHPLFGSNFDNKINLEEQVQKKLQDAVETFATTKKKKKKHKKHNVEIASAQEEDIFKFLNEPSASVQSDEVDEGLGKKKKKKKNKNYDDYSTEASVEMHSDGKKRKYEFEDGAAKKKKKKSRKHHEDDSATDSLIQQMIMSESALIHNKKKKKDHH